MQIELVDISEGGCMIEVPGIQLKPGVTVVIEVNDRDDISGQVVWHQGSKAGIEFHTPLTSEALGELLMPTKSGADKDRPMRDGFGRDLPPLGGWMRLQSR